VRPASRKGDSRERRAKDRADFSRRPDGRVSSSIRCAWRSFARLRNVTVKPAAGSCRKNCRKCPTRRCATCASTCAISVRGWGWRQHHRRPPAPPRRVPEGERHSGDVRWRRTYLRHAAGDLGRYHPGDREALNKVRKHSKAKRVASAGNKVGKSWIVHRRQRRRLHFSGDLLPRKPTHTGSAAHGPRPV